MPVDPKALRHHRGKPYRSSIPPPLNLNLGPYAHPPALAQNLAYSPISGYMPLAVSPAPLSSPLYAAFRQSMPSPSASPTFPAPRYPFHVPAQKPAPALASPGLCDNHHTAVEGGPSVIKGVHEGQGGAKEDVAVKSEHAAEAAVKQEYETDPFFAPPLPPQAASSPVPPVEEVDPFYTPPLQQVQAPVVVPGTSHPPVEGKIAVGPYGAARAKKSDNPTFLTKLYELLRTPEHHDIICWDEDGLVVRIEDPAGMQREILPIVYNQTKFASFSRQLNIYGFMRKTSLRHTPDAIDHKDASTWAHEFLTRDSTHSEVASVKRRVQARPDFPLPPGRKRRPAAALARLSSPPVPSAPSPVTEGSGGAISSGDESTTDDASDLETHAWELLFSDSTGLRARPVRRGRKSFPASISLPAPASVPVPGLSVSPQGTFSISAAVAATSQEATVPLPMPSPALPLPAGGDFSWQQNAVPGSGSISPAMIHGSALYPGSYPSHVSSPFAPAVTLEDSPQTIWRPSLKLPWSTFPEESPHVSPGSPLPKLPLGGAGYLPHPYGPSFGIAGARLAQPTANGPIPTPISPVPFEFPFWAQQAAPASLGAGAATGFGSETVLGLGLGLSLPFRLDTPPGSTTALPVAITGEQDEYLAGMGGVLGIEEFGPGGHEFEEALEAYVSPGILWKGRGGSA